MICGEFKLLNVKINGAFKFLFEGNGSHFMAVIKAHFSFYAHLPSTLKKRDEMRLRDDFVETTTGVYTENIVFAHFVKGVKSYSEL